MFPATFHTVLLLVHGPQFEGSHAASFLLPEGQSQALTTLPPTHPQL